MQEPPPPPTPKSGHAYDNIKTQKGSSPRNSSSSPPPPKKALKHMLKTMAKNYNPPSPPPRKKKYIDTYISLKLNNIYSSWTNHASFTFDVEAWSTSRYLSEKKRWIRAQKRKSNIPFIAKHDSFHPLIKWESLCCFAHHVGKHCRLRER